MIATEIQQGDLVLAVDAYGRELTMTAESGVEVAGHDFPIVWVSRTLPDGTTDRVPWPLESLRVYA